MNFPVGRLAIKVKLSTHYSRELFLEWVNKVLGLLDKEDCTRMVKVDRCNFVSNCMHKITFRSG